MRQFNCSVTGAIVSLSFLGILAYVSPALAQTGDSRSVDQLKPLEVPRGSSKDLDGLSSPSSSPFQGGLNNTGTNPSVPQPFQVQPSDANQKPINTTPPIKLEWPNQGEPPASGGTVPLVNF